MSDISNPVLSKYVLPLMEGETLLDIGAGAGLYGFLARYAYARTKNGTQFKKIDGVEIELRTYEALKKHNLYDSLYMANAIKLPFEDNSYDTVICLEQLEHLYEEEFYEVINELYRVCKKSLIISTPPPSKVSNFEDTKVKYEELLKEKFVSYDRFLEIEASAHKSCVSVSSLSDAKFQTFIEDGKIKVVEEETCVYFGDKETLEISKLKLIHGARKIIYTPDMSKNYKEEALLVYKNQLALQVYCGI